MIRAARFFLAFVAVLSVIPVAPALAAPGTHDNVDDDHLAVQGYDVVAYFTTGKPTKGDSAIAAGHGGHTYRFASAENKKKFLEAPDKYVPQYGGWCATAMAEGKKVEIDPATFKITGGKLYLFYNGFWGNALKDWNKDEPNNIVKADKFWKGILATKP